MTYPKSIVSTRRMSRRTRAALFAKAPPVPHRDPIPLPLFEAPAVTEADIAAWVASVCAHLGLEPGTRRYAHYIRSYDVAGKVAHAKADGRFQQLIDQGRHWREASTRNMRYDSRRSTYTEAQP